MSWPVSAAGPAAARPGPVRASPAHDHPGHRDQERESGRRDHGHGDRRQDQERDRYRRLGTGLPEPGRHPLAERVGAASLGQLHGRPREYWSVAVQGAANVSHGCVNISPAGAQFYYQMAVSGDPVTITGSPRPGVWGNGWTVWFLTWDQYLKGSALHMAVRTGPTGSAFVDPATLAASTATTPTGTSGPGNSVAG